MIVAPIPTNDAQRILNLLSYDILDTNVERAFDALTNAAALICGVPISVVSLIDLNRQWFKSAVGLIPGGETPRDVSFCGHVILGKEIFEVRDAKRDGRFHDNPFVEGDPSIRFYAGVPLIDSNDFALGTLCVIDRKPRRLSDTQRRALQELGTAVVRLMEARKQTTHAFKIQQTAQSALSEAHLELQKIASRLEENNRLLTMASEMTSMGYWRLTSSKELFWSDEVYRIHGMRPEGGTPDLEFAINAYCPEDRKKVAALVERALESGEDFWHESQLIGTDGVVREVTAWCKCERAKNGSATELFGVFQDITERKKAEQERLRLDERARLATEAGNVGIFEVYASDKFFVADDRLKQLFGVGQSGQKIEPVAFSARLHPDDADRVAIEFSTVFSDRKPYETEYRVIKPDGEIRHLRARGTVLYDGDQPIRLIGALWDVTEQRVLTEQLHEEKERLHVTLSSIKDAVIVTDENACVTFMNPIAEKLVGWSASEAVSKPLDQIFHLINDETGEPVAGPLERCLEDGSLKLEDNITLISRNGTHHAIQESVGPVKTQRGEVVGAVLVFQDVSRAREVQRALSFSATRDTLTGLFNRDKFEMECQSALELMTRNYTIHALCFVDLDRFKLVNDNAGHAAGDRMLQEVASAMRCELRSTDIVGRLGGDEFGVLLRDCPVSKAKEICNKLIARISAIRLSWHGKYYDVGASIGVTMVTEASLVPALMQQADAACYASKHGGRNRVSLYDKSIASDGRISNQPAESQRALKIGQAVA